MNSTNTGNAFRALTASFLVLLALCQPITSYSGDNQDLVILSNVILEPGDVINFKGGWGAVLGVGEYGHTGMYLGKDPVKGPLFLDFTTTKKGRNKQEFKGRISSEKEFLVDNIGHEEFDVYRLNQIGVVDQETFRKKLLVSAKDIAEHKTYGALIDCSNAASRVLSVAANIPMVEVTPNGFADDFRFRAVSLTVNTSDALNELSREEAGKSNGGTSSTSFLQDVAGIQQISTQVQDTLTAQEAAEERM